MCLNYTEAPTAFTPGSISLQQDTEAHLESISSTQLSHDSCSVQAKTLMLFPFFSFFYVFGYLICMSVYAACVHTVPEKISKRLS